MLKLIEQGVPQAEIQESAYRYQQDIESGRRRIVGVNAFKVDDDARDVKAKLLKVSPKLERDQVKRLKAFKKSRDVGGVKRSLEALANGAKSKDNLFPLVLHCVEASATLGEICGSLRTLFGEYHGR